MIASLSLLCLLLGAVTVFLGAERDRGWWMAAGVAGIATGYLLLTWRFVE